MNEARDFFRFFGEALMYAYPAALVLILVVLILERLFPGKGEGTTYGGGPR